MGQVFSGTRPTPNGTGLNLNKQVWDGFGNYLKNPGWVWVLPYPAPIIGYSLIPRPNFAYVTLFPFNVSFIHSSTVLGMVASCSRKPKSTSSSPLIGFPRLRFFRYHRLR